MKSLGRLAEKEESWPMLRVQRGVIWDDRWVMRSPQLISLLSQAVTHKKQKCGGRGNCSFSSYFLNSGKVHLATKRDETHSLANPAADASPNSWRKLVYSYILQRTTETTCTAVKPDQQGCCRFCGKGNRLDYCAWRRCCSKRQQNLMINVIYLISAASFGFPSWNSVLASWALHCTCASGCNSAICPRGIPEHNLKPRRLSSSSPVTEVTQSGAH